jgi:hypothetical protein
MCSFGRRGVAAGFDRHGRKLIEDFFIFEATKVFL